MHIKTAILFGASGNIGAHLLRILLASDEYTHVKIVLRKTGIVNHPKLVTILADYYSLEKKKSELAADDVFIILGASDKTVERQYPVLAATVCREKGAKTVSFVTSVGADPKSAITFTRIKGQIEQDILQLNYEHTHIYRPSMIMGTRSAYRPAEKTMMKIWPIIHPFLMGQLSRYKGMEAALIARAMYMAPLIHTQRLNIYHWKEMNTLAHTFPQP